MISTQIYTLILKINPNKQCGLIFVDFKWFIYALFNGKCMLYIYIYIYICYIWWCMHTYIYIYIHTHILYTPGQKYKTTQKKIGKNIVYNV